MYEIMDLSPMVVEHPLRQGTAYEVLVTLTPDVGDEVIDRSPVFYRTRADAEEYASAVYDALFTARCRCGVPADFLESIEDLEVTAYCSDACRDEAGRESDALERAGL